MTVLEQITQRVETAVATVNQSNANLAEAKTEILDELAKLRQQIEQGEPKETLLASVASLETAAAGHFLAGPQPLAWASVELKDIIPNDPAPASNN